MLSSILADIRYSARSLSKHAGLVAVIVLTLSLGIGANVAIFSLFQQILLRPLPVPEPHGLVNLSDPGPKLNGSTYGSIAGARESLFSYPMFRDLERLQPPIIRIAAHRIFEGSLSTGGQARLDTGIFVSGSYFSVLRLKPALGRLLGPQDDRLEGQADSVVLSYSYWQSAFEGDPEVLGRTLIVSGTPLSIVGVAPPGFRGTTVGTDPSVFVPITFRESDTPFSFPNHNDRDVYWVHLFARLEQDVERDDAAVAINSVFRAILNEIEAPILSGTSDEELDAFRSRSLVLEGGAHGQSTLRAPLRGRLELLLAISGVVLLLCCANVAALMLARGLSRSGEMAVRASVGATRARLASLLLAESLVLAVPAAAASLPIALLALRVIASGVPGLPSAAFDVSLDLASTLAAICVAVVSALAVGLSSVQGQLRLEPANGLQIQGVRQTSAKRVMRFRRALATAQIALSMALVAVMGLFVQSLANIARIDLGLEIDSVVTFTVSPAASGYPPEASARLFDRLDEELAASPLVDSATSTMIPLLSGGGVPLSVGLAGDDPRVRAYFNLISPGFFQTLGVRLLAGRDFSDADTADAPRVAIVTQRFAERLGMGADIVGRRITFQPEAGIEVVGLAADAKYLGITQEIQPYVFLPRRQSTAIGSATFYVRGERPPRELQNVLRQTVSRLDPIVPIIDLQTMRQQISDNLQTERFVTGVATTFAILATVLAGLGVYGVLAYSVAQRSREIGLRLALGAPGSSIGRMVLRDVAATTLVGISLGIGFALWLGRIARNLLFGVETTDSVALSGAAAVVAAVALAAAYFPVRRASRVDPTVVLRYE